MGVSPLHPVRHDDGFTLVEIVIAIVLVGILSAVVVVGVAALTSSGSSAGCSASRDAARAGAMAYWARTTHPASTFAEMITAGTLELPPDVTVDATGTVAAGPGWTLQMSPGSGNLPRFTCTSGAPPTGFSIGPNGHFYRFVTGTVDWATAASAAATYHDGATSGYLATVTSAAEQDFVYSLIGTTNSAWLGATDSAVEGQWRWSGGPENGTVFSIGSVSSGGAYVRWSAGQPDNAGDEDCLHIYVSFGNVWNDVPCNWPSNTGYVVEIGG